MASKPTKAGAQIKALARKHTKSAINVLAGIMNQADGPATARVSAAQALLDRGWGRASQPLRGDELGVLQKIERVIIDPNGNDSEGEPRPED